MSEIQRLRQVIGAGEHGCRALLFDAVRCSHGLLDDVEQTIDGMMQAAEDKAASDRLAYESRGVR